MRITICAWDIIGGVGIWSLLYSGFLFSWGLPAQLPIWVLVAGGVLVMMVSTICMLISEWMRRAVYKRQVRRS